MRYSEPLKLMPFAQKKVHALIVITFARHFRSPNFKDF